MGTIKISQLPSATSPVSRASLVPVVQGGVTVKATLGQLQEIASVTDYGAVGDGITDDSAAIQAAVTANDAVFFPTGTYKVGTPINLKSNNMVFGEGASSVIYYTGSVTSKGALFADSNSSSSYVENLIIRDLKVLGDVATAGFSEFVHLISLHGVRNCLIENCEIVGFRGDGIILGSGLNTPSITERHNVNVTIRDCYIDGVNNDNRNGVSVIDGNSINIDNNYFTRCSRSSMPGAIDVEPDASVFHVIRDISIRNNRIDDCRGGVAAITILLPIQTFTTAPSGFVIEGNYINTPNASSNNTYGIFFEFGNPFAAPPIAAITEATPNLGVRILNNYVKFPNTGPGRCMVVWNINDAVIANNEFVGGSTSLIGYPGTNVLDLALVNNSFTSVNGTGDYAVSVFTGSRITFEGNVFKDCGATSGAARGAIEFTTGTTSYVSLLNNTFLSPNGTFTQQAIRDSGHTFTPNTNQFFGNNLIAGTNQFQSIYADSMETAYTPTVEGGGSAGTGTYTLQFGRYRRIGGLVFFRVVIHVNAGHTGTGVIEVSLPTAVQAQLNNEETMCAANADGVTSTGGIVGLINPAALVGTNGCVRIYQTATGTTNTVTIPAGAFKVAASGYYIAA